MMSDDEVYKLAQKIVSFVFQKLPYSSGMKTKEIIEKVKEMIQENQNV
jgi:hypothetical protein